MAAPRPVFGSHQPLSRAQMRCCLLSCQHTNDTYAISRPKGPEPGINTHQGGSHQLKIFDFFFEVRSGLPSKFPDGGGGVPSAKNFLSRKTLTKLKLLEVKSGPRSQFPDGGGGVPSAENFLSRKTPTKLKNV